jgi:transposase
MTRLYGRAFSGERLDDYVPDIRFERMSVMGAMGLGGIVAPLTYRGTLDGKLFRVYIKDALAPAMKGGDTLILDNLSAHKVKGAMKPLEDKGIKVVFLPRYSPDFNPIKLAWSKIKAYLCKEKARTIDRLYSAVSEALDRITQEDIRGWISHCGHGLR